MNKNDQRKSYFKVMDPLLQKDLLIYLGVFWGSWFVLQCLFIYAVIFSDTSGDEPSINRVQVAIFGFVLFSALLFLVAILLFNRFLNRVTGPIYRMKADLIEYTAGRSQKPTQIRKGDYFEELSETINLALASHSGSSVKPERE